MAKTNLLMSKMLITTIMVLRLKKSILVKNPECLKMTVKNQMVKIRKRTEKGKRKANALFSDSQPIAVKCFNQAR